MLSLFLCKKICIQIFKFLCVIVYLFNFKGPGFFWNAEESHKNMVFLLYSIFPLTFIYLSDFTPPPSRWNRPLWEENSELCTLYHFIFHKFDMFSILCTFQISLKKTFHLDFTRFFTMCNCRNHDLTGL